MPPIGPDHPDYSKLQRYQLCFQPTYRKQIPERSDPEYIPKGRFINFTLPPANVNSKEDFYNRNGVPHEVSLPNNEYVPFKVWVKSVAKTWVRFVPQPTLGPLNQELFGDVYDRGLAMRFFSVIRARVKRNVAYATWTKIATELMDNVLIEDFALDSDENGQELGPEQGQVFRLRTLCFILHYYDFDSESAWVNLRRFIASNHMRMIFNEYQASYLNLNPTTSNSCWNIIQPRMAKMQPEIARQVFGTYGTVPLKDGWSHDDHATRFILCLYEILQIHMQENQVTHMTTLGFEAYGWSGFVGADVLDKYWFGWALLTFLTKSWQCNQQKPNPEYVNVLAPALYANWEMGHAYDLPDRAVAMIDLSPVSKWETDDVSLNRGSVMDAVDQGILEEEHEDMLMDQEYESETELR